MTTKGPELFDQCFSVARLGCTNYKSQGEINGFCSLRPEETNLQCVLLYGKACEWFSAKILPSHAELYTAYGANGDFTALDHFHVCKSCRRQLVQGKGFCKECQRKEAEARFKRVTAVDAAKADTIRKGSSSRGETIFIFTDGACQPNPGTGGWGALIRAAGCETHEMSGGERDSTNNKMELTAAIEALKYLQGPSKVVLTTDSQYMKNGISQWIIAWKRNGWRTADKKPVKNADLWRELDALNRQHKVDWRWVKGHDGHPENERCDQLANEAIAALDR